MAAERNTALEISKEHNRNEIQLYTDWSQKEQSPSLKMLIRCFRDTEYWLREFEKDIQQKKALAVTGDHQ